MVAEAVHVRPANEQSHLAVAAMNGGQVCQNRYSLAAVREGLKAAIAGEPVSLKDTDIHEVIKKSGEVWLQGCKLWWDHSANAATMVPQFGDKDFFLGCADQDAASTATSGYAALNKYAGYIIDLHKSAGDVVPVLTAGAPYAFNRGGAFEMGFSLTAEAQKLDFLSKRSFPVASKWIVDILAEVVTTADADVGDLTLGVANGTHASDAEAITEFAAAHFDLGADLNIDTASDDGTTDVDPDDTGVDFVVGTPFLLTIDGRDHTDIQFYINGVLVNADVVHTLAAATGPLKLLLHLEKSSNDSPGVVRIHDATVRLFNE